VLQFLLALALLCDLSRFANPCRPLPSPSPAAPWQALQVGLFGPPRFPVHLKPKPEKPKEVPANGSPARVRPGNGSRPRD
jgi:hypothetical protein